MRRIPALVIAAALTLLVWRCTTASSSTSGAAVARSGPTGEFKNLQVLQPASREELLTTMRGFTHALGVKCTFCHAPLPGSEDKLDFPSDAKPEKSVARTMIRMRRAINEQYIAKLPEQEATVSCETCHRGKNIPEVAKAAEPERKPGS